MGIIASIATGVGWICASSMGMESVQAATEVEAVVKVVCGSGLKNGS